MINFDVLSSSKYLPGKAVLSSELDQRLGWTPGTALANSGVQSRHYSDPQESTLSLAREAAQRALDAAKLRVEDLGAVIVGATVPQQAIPSTASLLLAALSCRTPVAAFDINATCLSFLVALESALLRLPHANKPILVVSAEVPSLALDFENPKQNSEILPLFGDGAAAVIIAPGQKWRFLGSCFESYSEGAEICQIPGFGTAQYDAMKSPRAYYELTRFRMDGPKLFRLTSRKLDDFFPKILSRAGLQKPHELDWFLFHQASGSALELVMRRYGLDAGKTVSLLASHGNTVASSLGMCLHEFLHQKGTQVKSNQHLMMLGSSAGVSLGALMLRKN
jgi:3-oxoacyl-[acyl-carrier-protein] synthase-3